MAVQSSFNARAILPRQRLGIGAEMKVTVMTDLVCSADDVVKAILVHDEETRQQCPVVCSEDERTYYISVVPKRLGEQKLLIEVKGKSIQGSPFNITVVPQHDYTQLEKPLQKVTSVNKPASVFFSDNGDMYASSWSDWCIDVLDSAGEKKNTIGGSWREWTNAILNSNANGEDGATGSVKEVIKFKSPYGIAVDGEVLYVAEFGINRVHKLTTTGDIISTYGEEGSDIGQFDGPFDIKVSPDGKVYVAESGNSRVQVFHPDWTISHVIDGKVSGDGGFSRPMGIAFDLSGDVHITGSESSSVTVYSPMGKFVRKYTNQTHIGNPHGIAIDESGNSVISNNDGFCLSVFDSSGKHVHSTKRYDGFCPWGVAFSPDGSLWVADIDNGLLKYT